MDKISSKNYEFFMILPSGSSLNFVSFSSRLMSLFISQGHENIQCSHCTNYVKCVISHLITTTNIVSIICSTDDD